MNDTPGSDLDALWARHHAEWRDPAQIASQWEDAAATDTALLRARVGDDWWALLERLDITLLITREYEHLVVALAVEDGRKRVSFMRLPHPSGMVADRERGRVHIASTRNPNQVFELAPATAALSRRDAPPPQLDARPLLPVGSRYYPGALYMHDLALIGGRLHANAVGENAVVRLGEDGAYERVWWPRAIERDGAPEFGRNHLQVNSIAAGADVEHSFFSASTDAISARRPGHANFPVDGRGVIFSGATREPIARGLTRPHSARVHGGEVWVDNSGYGELGAIRNGRLEVVARLPGWTRGLAFCEDVAFVGTSRVIPRFRQYAPGLDIERSVCGVSAVDTRSGATLASLTWPTGNQIFAIDWLPRAATSGLAFTVERPRSRRTRNLFYAFQTSTTEEDPPA